MHPLTWLFCAQTPPSLPWERGSVMEIIRAQHTILLGNDSTQEKVNPEIQEFKVLSPKSFCFART